MSQFAFVTDFSLRGVNGINRRQRRPCDHRDSGRGEETGSGLSEFVQSFLSMMNVTMDLLMKELS
jgi:hypothetical protein